KNLFEHEWQPNDPLAQGDGLGPVFNARSCVACHFQGGVGGSGPNENNVVAYEVLPTRQNPEIRTGVVHAFAVDPSFKEDQNTLKQLVPPIPGGIRQDLGCGVVQVQPFDPVRVESINTPALFGAGWIDRIDTKAITNNHWKKALADGIKEFDHDFAAIPA